MDDQSNLDKLNTDNKGIVRKVPWLKRTFGFKIHDLNNGTHIMFERKAYKEHFQPLVIIFGKIRKGLVVFQKIQEQKQ